MKTRIFFAMLITVLTFGTKINAQTKSADKQKTVLLINAHLTYLGLSEGKLNKAFYDKAKEFFLSQNFKVLETKIEAGYNVEEEVEKHMQADIIVLQTPVNWENTPWIYKKYVDEVFTNAMFSKKFLSGDGRSETDPTKEYGTGGKMQGKKFLLSATWNAPEESFNNPKQPLWKGKSADDALSNIGANYAFVGYKVLPGHYCYDVFHNKHIKEDLENYPKYLKKVFGL
ncbi:NAD(P)H-dependent oxidoreductase [Flavobacterium sp. MDT1-60]|uniref:NAD(P)H-dependent oxidoreductase n=1 Tax=Flavobacterium sp. MDT1-60 TaxID=1979344 RepID=UPI001782475E|nr:NAD(P)H-dependent oxidoreductase [Flavobacterium sp. MDT1-60]QOG01564.1 NAD(P)H-dependent oxidoreductase [Flavobacterium sp. MDT1-60]